MRKQILKLPLIEKRIAELNAKMATINKNQVKAYEKTLTLSPKQIASLLQINTLLYQNKFYSLEVSNWIVCKVRDFGTLGFVEKYVLFEVIGKITDTLKVIARYNALSIYHNL